VRKLCAVAVLLLFAAAAARADEGMYLLNRPPRELLRKKYDFDLTDAWLERAMKASVRFNNGGSGGFVSPDGLVVTNHHIGDDTIQKLSGKGKDYYLGGFAARTRDGELKCPDLELNVLQSITDVTDEVNAAVKPGLAPAEAGAARRAVMSRIESESKKKTGLRSDVVTLYNGGQYHLYRYKKYTDVRLVFAPEKDAASFGGDVDNFEYPRFNLDVCFFRVYEDGKPARTGHFFPWARKGPQEDDLVFVSGHPGSTNRLETLVRLKHRRDLTLPYTLRRLRYMEALLSQFAERGPAERRMAAQDLYPVANARKAITGQYHGLLDPAIIARKTKDEKALRDAVAADAGLAKEYGGAWARVEAAQKGFAAFEKEYSLLELGHGFNSRYFVIARHLVRMADELPKPSDKRLREYRDSALDSLKFQLFSPAPVHPELERVKLAGSLMFLAENLGGEHPLVRTALRGKSPADRAAELVAGTALGDPKERRRLADGGRKALDFSSDEMIELARVLDAPARQVRQRYEAEVDEPEQQAYGQIARARFALFGQAVPPDATFTLRLAFGTVSGYTVDGKKLPFATTFGGAFEREKAQGRREPFVLPDSWHRAKGKLNLKTPFNFVATSDTIGGNSGSPVLNRRGELVGLNFDRNRHGLVRNYVYTDQQARHVSVHCESVLEALRSVYDAGPLLEELLNPSGGDPATRGN
jgi:hypothetical protein